MDNTCNRHPGEVHFRQEDWKKLWRDRTALLEALEVVPDFLADSATWAKWNDVRRAAIAQARGEDHG